MKQKRTLSSIFVYLVFILFIVFLVMAYSVYAVQLPVNLGTADNFVILAKSGISTTGTTSIVGDIGVSPIDSTAITGFGLILDSTTQFATSSLVEGKVYASDYTLPTPSVMTTAISDMETAYTDAAGRALPNHTGLGAGNIDGMTLAPGLYKWGTGVTIPNNVTLSGNANDVWIFQIAQDLTVGNDAIIILSGEAQAKNIFWQVAGQATLGTTSVFNGNILCQTAIVLDTGATLNGRALAQTAVTLDANDIQLNDENTSVLQAQLIVIKHVINNDNGVKSDSDFVMLVTGVNPNKTNFSGKESGTLVKLDPGAYSVDETEDSGYTKTLSAGCSGAIAAGESKICTITNNDINSSSRSTTLTVTKVVINDNNGTAVVSDFTLLINDDQVASGIANDVAPGEYTVSEIEVSKYDGTISGDCNSDGSITLDSGDEKTCIITNDDIDPVIVPEDEVPEFGMIGVVIILISAGLIIAMKRKNE